MMRLAILALLAAAGLPLPAGAADLIRRIEADPATGSWTITVPGWSATLTPGPAEAMQADLALHPAAGKAMSGRIDQMGPNLPEPLALEAVALCGAEAAVLGTADLVGGEGEPERFVYRRTVALPGHGILGTVTDEASAKAGGLLPAALVADALAPLCPKG